jgi:hypothetical protein
MTVAAAVAAALAAPLAVMAQTSDATLQGTAAPGTEVVARNKNTGITRKTTARLDGTYTLVGLPPGEYAVSNGAKSVDVTLSVATTSQLNLGEALEQVIVTGQRLVETRTSQVGALISPREIETVPAITRNFLEFADTVPGVMFTVDGQGNTSFRGGAQQDENVNVYIDGVSMKDLVQGGVSGQSGPNKNPNQGGPGNPFPQSAIAEYKVITSNYSAEYDQLASAAIAAQTKSGTNTLHADVFGNYTNQNLRADTPAEVAASSPTNPKAPGSKTDEWGVSLGGPIIPDQMHYFGAFERKELSEPNVVYPSSASGLTTAQAQALLPASVAAQFGPTTNPFSETLFFGKLDYEPTSSDRLELWDLTRTEHEISGAQGQTAASAATQFENKNNRVTLRWQHFAENWLNELKVAYQNASSAPTASSTNPELIYNYLAGNGPQELIAVNGGTAWQQFAQSQKGPTVQDEFTLTELHWLGNHTVKAGIKASWIDLKYQDAGQGLQFNYIVTPPSATSPGGTFPTPYDATFTLSNPGKSNVATSSDRQYGVYLQDDWTLDQHWTANIGVRWDYEVVPSWQNFVTPQPIVQSLYGPFPGVTTGETYAQALALGGVNIGDYVSTGSNRHAQSDEYQPRVGLSYDIFADQRHVIFGGWGRAYDRNIYNLMSLELTKSALSEPTIDFYGSPYAQNGCKTAANTQPGSCIAWDPRYLTSLSALQGTQTTPYGEIDLINNHIKNPYSDQFTLGIRNRLADWNTSVALTQVNSYNRLVGWLGERDPGGNYFVPCGWSGSGYAPAWCGNNSPSIAHGNLVLWDNAARDQNRAVLVSFERPYTKESGWSAHVAYTYSDARQTDTYAYSGNNAYQFDYPKPQYFPWTPSSAVAKHRLVATGSIDGIWGIVWSGKVALATPMNLGGQFVSCRSATTPPALPAEFVGCNNNWDYPVTAHPRDLWGEHTLDVAATKHWDFTDRLSAYFRVDVLNVFNAPYYDPAAEIWSPGPQQYGKTAAPPVFNTAGPILGVPFTIKFTAGASW